MKMYGVVLDVVWKFKNVWEGNYKLTVSMIQYTFSALNPSFWTLLGLCRPYLYFSTGYVLGSANRGTRGWPEVEERRRDTLLPVSCLFQLLLPVIVTLAMFPDSGCGSLFQQQQLIQRPSSSCLFRVTSSSWCLLFGGLGIAPWSFPWPQRHQHGQAASLPQGLLSSLGSILHVCKF